jgi:hypothetical protein
MKISSTAFELYSEGQTGRLAQFLNFVAKVCKAYAYLNVVFCSYLSLSKNITTFSKAYCTVRETNVSGIRTRTIRTADTAHRVLLGV